MAIAKFLLSAECFWRAELALRIVSVSRPTRIFSKGMVRVQVLTWTCEMYRAWNTELKPGIFSLMSCPSPTSALGCVGAFVRACSLQCVPFWSSLQICDAMH